MEVEGVNLYYRHPPGPSPQAEAVILLHGFGGSSVDWDFILPLLGEYQPYAPDLIGAGLSDKALALDYSNPAQADLLAAWMAALGIDSAHIVGHDLGGGVAVELALRHPQRVRSLTLVAPSLLYEPTGGLPGPVLDWPFLRRWARILLRGILPESTEINFYSAAAQESFITPPLIERARRTYLTPDWEMGVLGLARDVQNNALRQPLGDIQAPVLIVWGEADTWIPPTSTQSLGQDIPQAELVLLPGVGHLPMYESPGEMVAALVSFWEKLGPG
jgi:pimeloyl-ACP methyl ester carboxylesterase